MITYMYFCSLLYENSGACFPTFGAARTPYLMYDLYTNDSKRELCFPTLLKLRQCIDLKDHLSMNNGNNFIEFALTVHGLIVCD